MNVGDARTEIMRSIRAHLAASPPADRAYGEVNSPFSQNIFPPLAAHDVVEVFKRNLELVDGHCVIAQTDAEVAEAVNRIAKGRRIAVSTSSYSKQDLFTVDVGITSAQAGIAETGTLVLDSSVERNRLVSLVPPIHIAILDASKIFLTLGETLAALQTGEELSPAITFITGPSRTADIELTLTLGVHGPQELYVIINEGVPHE
ncbi:MAG: lactate utilization protein C [Pyrinomonadaceae bacterium]